MTGPCSVANNHRYVMMTCRHSARDNGPGDAWASPGVTLFSLLVISLGPISFHVLHPKQGSGAAAGAHSPEKLLRYTTEYIRALMYRYPASSAQADALRTRRNKNAQATQEVQAFPIVRYDGPTGFRDLRCLTGFPSVK